MYLYRFIRYHDLLANENYDAYYQLKFYFIGGYLSEDGKIAIGSSISVFILTSSLFLFIGYLCGLYHHKLRQQPPPSVLANQPTPVYEYVLPTDHHNLELNMNVAYASVQ